MESKLLPNGLSAGGPKMKCLSWDGSESKLNFLFNVEKLNYNSKLVNSFGEHLLLFVCKKEKKKTKEH